MRRVSHFLAAFLLAGGASPAIAKDVTGTWTWMGREGAGITLEVVQVGSNVDFQLEISRGAPSYNSGYIKGSFELANGVGIFRTTQHGDCEITFTFSGR